MSFALKIRRSLKMVEEAPRAEEAPPDIIPEVIEDVLERRAKKLHFFRPSMLMGCDRANVFHYRMDPHHPSRQDPRMMRILDNGTAIHEVLQRYLGDHPHWWFAKETRVYRKVAGAWIRGSCDGVLIRRSDMYRVGIEIKSIAHNSFMKLTKPNPHHVRQATIYAKLQGLTWIIILYWDKDTQHLKEFPVKVTEKLWSEVKERIAYLKGFVDAGELPEFDSSTCDPTFCSSVDWCRKKGAPV